MLECILHAIVSTAMNSAGDSAMWKPAEPFSFVQDSSGKIVRFEAVPQWTSATKHAVSGAAAVFGKPQKP